MRAIHLAQLDKTRNALILTRSVALGFLANVTVAPITKTVRGIATEVPVGPDNGLDEASVVNLDNIVTIKTSQLGRQVGFLFDHQEEALAEAIRAAFDLI